LWGRFQPLRGRLAGLIALPRSPISPFFTRQVRFENRLDRHIVDREHHGPRIPLARWRATDNPIRHACAEELVAAVRDHLHLST